MSSIKGMLPADVEILRNGEKTSVEAKNLVLGDLVSANVRRTDIMDLQLKFY